MKKYLVLIGLCLFLMVFALSAIMGVRINLTSSMPIGIYIPEHKTGFQKGDWVSICLPNSVAYTGMQYGYLMYGSCPNNSSMPLFKKLIAVPGDVIEVKENEIVVNGKSIPAKIQHHDHLGHPLHFGSQLGVKMRTNQYWVYGANNQYSWDSRYYGGVDRSNILGSYKPFLVF